MKIGFSVKFNKAKYPSKKKLIGKYCSLEPVNAKKHAKDLYKNFSLDKKELIGLICQQVHTRLSVLLRSI